MFIVLFEYGYVVVNLDIKMESVDYVFYLVKFIWESFISDKENEVLLVFGNFFVNFFMN